MSKKNAKKTTTALENANRENADLRRSFEATQHAFRSQCSEAHNAIDTLVWALVSARRSATIECRRADEAESKVEQVQRQIDTWAFAEYDRAANDAFERHGLAPKFLKHALRDLKEHILSLDDSKAPGHPKKAGKFFDAFAKAYAQKNPELARRAPKKTKAKRSTPKKRAA